MKQLRHELRRLAILFAWMPGLAQAMVCGAPTTADEDSSGLSLQSLASRPAGMLSCAAGYWAEKCGDHATAHRIYDKCVAAGYAGAMIWKALLLEDGTGIARDEAAATRLLRRAADSGDAHYATLGKLHYATNLLLGRGIARDEAEARRWFEAAAAEGSEDAAEFLRTGHHTAVRDRSGRGVGAPMADVAGLRLIASDAPLPGELPDWVPVVIGALFLAGVARQALRAPVAEHTA